MSAGTGALLGAIVGAVLANGGWWFAEWTRFRMDTARDRRRRESEQ